VRTTLVLLVAIACAPPDVRPEAPRVRAVDLGPDAPTVASTIAAVVDADPHTTLSLAWTVDGRVVQRGPSTTLAGWFVKRDRVAVTVTAARDGLESEPLTSAPLEVDDAPPDPDGAPTLRPDAPRAGLQDLTCTPPAVSDPDGDEVSWRFAWTRSGEDVDVAVDGTRPGDTIPAAALREGEDWACTAWASDGEREAPSRAGAVRVAAGAEPAFGVPVVGPTVACVLDARGTPRCWGEDGDDRLASPPPGSHARLALGGGFGCGLRGDDLGLTCWGTSDARATPPDGPFTDVVLGEAHGCAARTDGTVRCWGWDGDGQASPPPGRLTGLAAGPTTTCALDALGHPVCWGEDVGVDALVDEAFVELAVGADHVCGRTAAGELLCAGRGLFGETRPPGGGPWRAVAAAPGETCGARDDEVVCFGAVDASWPVAVATLSMSMGPTWCGRSAAGAPVCGSTEISGFGSVWGTDVVPIERWTALALEDRLLCGLDAGGVVGCLGAWAAVGPPEEPLDAVATGADVACGLRRSDHHPVCWGWLDRNGLGAPPDVALASLAVGDGFACGLDAVGRATCWGDRAPAPPDVAFTALEAAPDWACGLLADATLACFGAADARALPPSGTFRALDLARTFGCGLRTTGRITCWGTGDVPAADPGPFTAVAAADDRACGLTDTGRPRCWGAAPVGLVEPDVTLRLVDLVAGADRVCGRRADGAVFCWGAIRRQPLP
jgi:hypothetical protein